MILEITKTNTVTLEYVDGKEPIRHEHERVYTTTRMLYHELSPAAKKLAREDAIEQEWQDPWGQYGMTYREIWSELEEIAKETPIRFQTGYSDEDVFAVTASSSPCAIELKDSGICWSMDLCEIWNRRLPLMRMIERAQEFAEGREDYNAYYSLRNAADAAWEALMQRTGDEMASYAKEMMWAERDYYTSHEFWDEWLDDGETWFTAEGERW